MLIKVNCRFFAKVLMAVFSLLILSNISGCNTIEKRPSGLPKKTLQQVAKSDVRIKTNWATSAGSGVGKSNANLTIAIQNDALFTADHKGLVTAINKSTGKKLWQVNLKEHISAGPAVSSSYVVVVLSSAKVVALNAETGAILWKRSISSESLAIPAMHQNLALIHTLDGKIINFDLSNGVELWRYSYSVPSIILRKSATPTIFGENIVSGLSNGKVIELNKAGHILWITDVSDYTSGSGSTLKRMSDISADTIVTNEVVYAVGHQGKLVALSRASGQVLWDKDASSYFGLASDSNRVYLADESGHMIAFDKNTGGKIWHVESLEGRHLSRPIIHGDKLIVADDDGDVHFMNVNSGEFVGRYHNGNKSIEATPILENNNLYVLDISGQVSSITISSSS